MTYQHHPAEQSSGSPVLVAMIVVGIVGAVTGAMITLAVFG